MAKKVEFKKWHLVVLVLLVVLTVVAKFFGYYWPHVTVKLSDAKFNVLVADTNKHKLKGLSGVDNMGEYGGMVFVFGDSGIYTMVMRDMKFALDIVWLKSAENNRCFVGSFFRQLFFGLRPPCQAQVVEIAPQAAPEAGVDETALTRYFTTKASNLVLELPSGYALSHGLKIGDVIEFK